MNAIASYQRGWNDRMLGRPFAPSSQFDSAYRAGYTDARRLNRHSIQQENRGEHHHT